MSLPGKAFGQSGNAMKNPNDPPAHKGNGSAAQAPPFLRVRNLVKRFGGFTALQDVSLDVYRGEFICFLGPSGCGKTTLLRAIAGLDPQDEGTIEINGRDVSRLPPAARDFGIVFQSYALFPNLTVAGNVGYGLVNRRKGRAAIGVRVRELLTLVGLSDQETKYPVQLSGGQQQRVALARALATSPGLLLLDEPLSALDARVRLRLRDEIRSLQRRLGVTTIMVTHDQEEALAMADRIVVMNHGVIDQVGFPQEIYRAPTTPFVADFVGSMTFLDAEVLSADRLRIGTLEITCADAGRFVSGTPVRLGLRPEEVRVRNLDASTPNAIDTTVTGLNFLGAFCRAQLQPAGAPEVTILADFSANLMRDLSVSQGQRLTISLPPDSLRVFARN
jgi:iron(III) transport system ATP-binding protein